MDWLLGSVHSGAIGRQHTINGGVAANLTDGFHVVGLEWEAQALRWYLDGSQFLQAVSSSGSGGPPGWYTVGAGGDHPHAPFDVPFHLLLNLAVGGNFPWVAPEAVAQTLASGPRCMWVDWVRVWGRPHR